MEEEENVNILIYKKSCLDKKNKNIETGLANEKLAKQVIENYFKTILKKSNNQYSAWDFIDLCGVIYEYKSNNCSIDTYETIVLSKHKITRLSYIENKIILVMSFVEGHNNIFFYYMNIILEDFLIHNKYKTKVIQTKTGLANEVYLLHKTDFIKMF